MAVSSMALAIASVCLMGTAPAATVIYEAVVDFPVIDAGEVPYYSEAPGRSSLAINAAREDYRNRFARATLRHEGESAFYDITLTSLAELDGEAEYRVLVNDVLVGVASNPKVDSDYTPIRHTFEGIVVPHGATIAVESLANTNGRIPEGDGTAYARGRWTSLELDNGEAESSGADEVDLTLSASMDTEHVRVGDTFSMTLDITNGDDSAVATGVHLALTRPRAEVALASENTLACLESGNDIICELSEIAAGNTTQLSVSLEALAVSPNALLRASVTTDQTDINPEDNTLILPLSITEQEAGGDNQTPDIDTPDVHGSEPVEHNPGENEALDNGQGDSPDEAVSTNGSSGGGALSLWTILLLALTSQAVGRFRYWPTRASGCGKSRSDG